MILSGAKERILQQYLIDVRAALITSWDDGDLSGNEFIMLYDLNKSRNDYPYWRYEGFELDSLDDDEAWVQFRFFRNDIYRLKEVLHIPDIVRTYNRMIVDGVEALCIFLKRFAYPCRYVDRIPHFGRAIPDYSIVTNMIIDHIYRTFSHLLSDFNHPMYATAILEEYCAVIHAKGAPLCLTFHQEVVQ